MTVLSIVVIEADMPIQRRISAASKPFWDGLADRKFLVTQCNACGTLGFPPQQWCRACGHQNMTWQPLSGRATVYSLTTVHAGPPSLMADGPYSGAIVDLDEGVRVVTRWWGLKDVPLDNPCELIVLKYRDGDLFAARPLRS